MGEMKDHSQLTNHKVYSNEIELPDNWRSAPLGRRQSTGKIKTLLYNIRHVINEKNESCFTSYWKPEVSRAFCSVEQRVFRQVFGRSNKTEL